MKHYYSQTDKRNMAQTVADELATQAGEDWAASVSWVTGRAGVWEITLLKFDAHAYVQEFRIAWVDLGF